MPKPSFHALSKWWAQRDLNPRPSDYELSSSGFSTFLICSLLLNEHPDSIGLLCICRMNGSEQVKGLQNRKKGTERVQTKLGKTHVDYWYSKLRKRIFSGRDGPLKFRCSDWQVRLKHLGRSMWFNLKTANAAEAAVKARDIYISLIANGWEVRSRNSSRRPKSATI